MNIIERAFQLAPQVSSRKQLRRALEKEGYSLVDAHLSGLGIKRELRKLYRNGGPRGKLGPSAHLSQNRSICGDVEPSRD